MLPRSCSVRMPTGDLCRATPLRESDYCLMHSPEHAQEMQEARRLGGLRRRREVTVAGAYDFDGLETVGDIRRLLMIAAVDTLGLDNTIPRSRTLVSLAVAAAKLLETGELEQRLAVLEGAVQGRKALPEPVFEAEPDTPDFSENEEADE